MKRTSGRRIRYAVVGLGHIAQAAALPAFAHARRNSELVALVSSDALKRRKLGRLYGVPTYDYGGYEGCLRSEAVDAVYLALPNHLHCDYAIRSAKAGVHILCEKPMAVTSAECERMIRSADEGCVKLMIAYRLHFEEANLRAAKLASTGKLGKLRLFASTFTMQVRPDNIRVRAEEGGSPLYDIGIYCIQAARYLFRAEPIEVVSLAVRSAERRFREVDETASAILRFPEDRLAAFTVSFGASDVSAYRVVGTKGDLRVEPGYEYAEALVHHLTVKGKTTTRCFAKRDQFAPELLHFSDCVLRDARPEPSGEEGRIDVGIIEALLESARRGRPFAIAPAEPDRRPTLRQERRAPPVRMPRLVHAKSASR